MSLATPKGSESPSSMFSDCSVCAYGAWKEELGIRVCRIKKINCAVKEKDSYCRYYLELDNQAKKPMKKHLFEVTLIATCVVEVEAYDEFEAGDMAEFDDWKIDFCDVKDVKDLGEVDE